MKFIKRIGPPYFFMLVLAAVIIAVAEYTFLTGHHLQGIFIGLWVPVVILLMIFFKMIDNGSR